jgi:integrase
MMLVDLNIDEVESHYRDLLDDGVSIRNVRYVHSLLHISLKDAAYRGVIATNPAHGARKPKLVPKEMQIQDEYQVMQLFIAAQGHRYEALFHIAVKTGLRQGEIFGLKCSDINWHWSNLRIQRQVYRVKGQGMVFSPPKTKAGRRTIPLGSETLQLLLEHRHRIGEWKILAGERWEEYNLVFPSQVGTPYSSSNLLKEYKSLLKEARLPPVRFHDLRHTAASIMLKHNVPPFVVSRILGHSKPSTTMDIYGHLIPIMHEDIGNQIDEWLTPIPVQMEKTVGHITQKRGK